MRKFYQKKESWLLLLQIILVGIILLLFRYTKSHSETNITELENKSKFILTILLSLETYFIGMFSKFRPIIIRINLILIALYFFYIIFSLYFD